MMFLAAIVLFVGLMIFISIRSSVRIKPKEYIIGDRKVGLLPTAASLVGSFRSGSGLAFWLIFGATLSYSALYLVLSSYFCVLIIACLGSKIHKLAKEEDMISLTDLVDVKIGERTGWLTTFLVIMCLLIGTGCELYVVGFMVSGLFDISKVYGIVLSSVVVGIYLTIGGYKSLIRTDVWQFVFMVVLALLAFIYFPPKGVMEIIEPMKGVDKDLLITFLILGTCQFSFMPLWQRMYSLSSSKLAVKSALIAIGFDVLIISGMIAFSQAMIKNLSIEDPKLFLEILFTSEALHPAIFISLIIFTLCIVMSSVDNNVYAISATIVKNVNKKTGSLKNFVHSLRLWNLLPLLLITIIAISIEDILKTMFDFVSLVTTLSPIVIISFFSRDKSKARDLYYFWVLLLGMIAYTIMFFTDAFKTPYSYGVPILVVLILGILPVLKKKLFITH